MNVKFTQKIKFSSGTKLKYKLLQFPQAGQSRHDFGMASLYQYSILFGACMPNISAVLYDRICKTSFSLATLFSKKLKPIYILNLEHFFHYFELTNLKYFFKGFIFHGVSYLGL
jgi:hypothetical protein